MIATILWAIIAGTFLGILARLLLPGRQHISVWLTIAAGIAAAFLGGLIANWMGVGNTSGIDWVKHIIQVVLAMVFVWLAAHLSSRSGQQRHSHA